MQEKGHLAEAVDTNRFLERTNKWSIAFTVNISISIEAFLRYYMDVIMKRL